MFRRGDEHRRGEDREPDRVQSVLGEGITWHGEISGRGGVRVDGAYDGEIAMEGMVVIGETGRVTGNHIRADSVIVAGSVKGDITANRVEIGRTGRVWGNVTTVTFSTQEGAFLRGQITMEEQVDLGLPSREEAEQDSEAAGVDVQEGGTESS
jgi:cytoskeletal protein CcmA (bactofilin family)